MRHPRILCLAICSVFGLAACSLASERQREKPEAWIPAIYKQYGLEGSFAFLRRSEGSLHIVNPGLVAKGRIPCSTFKIPNSLIFLEERVVPDEHTVLKWDGVSRALPAWNSDQDMQSAFRNSTIWCYQALARKVSEEHYRNWLARLQYGNDNLAAGRDRFWLQGGFRVSHQDQIRFLQGLDADTLPASARNMDIVRRVMIVEQTKHYVLRAKTGSGRDETDPSRPIGWWVGYVETSDDRLYFSSFVTSKEDLPDFPARRVNSTRAILSRMGVL